MFFFLHSFFHNETNDRTEKGLVRIPLDSSLWPEKWKTIEYKHYLLIKEVELPPTNGFLFNTFLKKRRSNTRFYKNKNLTLKKIAYILLCGYGLQKNPDYPEQEEHRTVPSAGKRYPLEIYIILFKKIDGCRPGAYHYNVKNHTLEPMFLKHFSREELKSFSPMEWIEDANGMICIGSVFHRSVDKYGSRAYRFILLEAGHSAQNMILAGTEDDINMVPLGGIREDNIEKALGLNIANERIVYVLSL